jgi:integrase
MITTFNGCYRSEITVKPANWNTKKASTVKPWRINYRFYDPAFANNPKLKKGKQIKILGMNHVAGLEERQAITRAFIDREKNKIDAKGYNPITGAYMAPPEPVVLDAAKQDLSPTTPFIQALKTIYSELTFERDTSRCIEKVLRFVEQSAILLKKNTVPLAQIKARDIKLILDNCKNLTVTRTKNKRVEVAGKLRTEKHCVNGKMVPVKIEIVSPKVWNENEFNNFKKYLSILYSELDRQEIVEYNPIKKISKKDTSIEDPDQVKRKVLTPEERRKIHLSLIVDFPDYLRYLNIFYHSGARIKEIMKVQGKNVDLAGQRFKVLIKKRKKWVWVWKTIKDVALPYWVEIMAGCGPDDYVFSKGLLPGPKPIRPEQVGRRWRVHIKKKLGIDSRQYDLKHLHTTEVINELEKLKAELSFDPVMAAAEHNSHTSGAMVRKIYDVDNDKREHNKVKGLKTSFAG